MCNHCRRRTIIMTRFLCLECWDDERGETVDYCSKCFFENLELVCSSVAPSSPRVYHPILQIRQFTFHKRFHHEITLARNASKDLHDREEDSAQCHLCHRTPLGRPYWCCLNCGIGDKREEKRKSSMPCLRNSREAALIPSSVYICDACNRSQEQKINLLVLEDTWASDDESVEPTGQTFLLALY